MLTALSHLLALAVFGNGFRDSWLHHLPRDQGEVDQPVAPQTFALALPEGRSDTGFLPGLMKTTVS